jgi:hypothetical protein
MVLVSPLDLGGLILSIMLNALLRLLVINPVCFSYSYHAGSNAMPCGGFEPQFVERAL